jgi:hypothetical protein
VNKLKITPTMISNAKNNKMVGFIEMNPLDFLRLTVNTPNVFDFIRQEKDHTKSLEDYNQFATSGKSIHMPWLDVDMYTGKVVGHEGRHRAMSVINADGRVIPVGICLRERGYPVYYKENKVEGEYRWIKRFMSKSEVPPVFIGQFVHREIKVDSTKMVEFWV